MQRKRNNKQTTPPLQKLPRMVRRIHRCRLLQSHEKGSVRQMNFFIGWLAFAIVAGIVILHEVSLFLEDKVNELLEGFNV